MILPCPRDPRNYSRFPLMLTLTALNVFIFILLFSGVSSQSVSSSSLLKREGLLTTGRIYYQYLQSLPAEELYQKPAWLRQIRYSNSDQLTVLGTFGLRDAQFLNGIEQMAIHGDEIAVAQWRKSVQGFREQYRKQILYRFGLSSQEKSPLSWVTYQFSHSSWMHLLSNLIFLVVLGAAVEALAGGGVLLAVYLLGGFVGGLGFLWLDPQGTVPMVGASASISALLAFYCLAETRKRIQYYYFVSPMPSHYGQIHLPTLLIVPLFLVTDLASLWSTPEGLGGGVAYVAHLGGAALGAFLGLVFRYKDRLFPRKITL